MKFLVLQHIDVEHPGIFRDFMADDGIEWDTVELDAGEKIPALDGYAALLVMGGPMDVWEEDKYPWLVDEKAIIREAVLDRQLPYLGFCLGHQLLAEALGGMVTPMKTPEVGILEVELSETGLNSPLFAGLQKRFNSLQWHGAEVSKVPVGSQVIAHSPACEIQALQVGRHAFSVQFHIELIDSTVSDWGKVPAYEKSLEHSLGPGALQKLDSEAHRNMSKFNDDARLMYNNFCHLLNQ